MADRHRKRVRRVVWPWRLIQPQQHRHEVLYLSLVRATVAHQRLLDLHWCVLEERQPLLPYGEQHDAAGVAYDQCGLSVSGEEQFLYAYVIRSEPVHQSGQLLVNHQQSVGQGNSGGSAYHAVFETLVVVPVVAYETEPQDGGPRVYAQHTQVQGCLYGRVDRDFVAHLQVRVHALHVVKVLQLFH